MIAILTTSELNEFCEKVDILTEKGYELAYSIDRQESGNFKVEIKGEHDIAELDKLTETA